MTKSLLTMVCCFTGLFAIWLTIMETVLQHEGYGWRIAIAASILLQSGATLFASRSHGANAFRMIVVAGALAIGWLGASATVRVIRAEHFEGFVVLLGVALILQAGLTLAGFAQADSLA